jgi:RNase P/RNase MRP subunit POP5
VVPVIIQPDEEAGVVMVSFVPDDEDALYETDLHLVTNVSAFDIPLTVYHGHAYISVEEPLHSLASSEEGDTDSGGSANAPTASATATAASTAGSADAEESVPGLVQIQFGALGVGEARSRTLEVANANPTPIPILSVRANVDTVRVRLARVINARGSTVHDHPTGASGTGTNAITLLPGYSVLFEIEVNSVRDEEREGRITVACADEQYLVRHPGPCIWV